jgi:hypothetical protein
MSPAEEYKAHLTALVVLKREFDDFSLRGRAVDTSTLVLLREQPLRIAIIEEGECI